MAKASSILFLAASGIMLATPAISGNLVYRPINPSFGGDPFYSSHLLGIAEANNRYGDPNALNVDDIIDRIETEVPEEGQGTQETAPAGPTEADLLTVPSQGGLLLPN
jgi:hypothetical protein